MRISDWSSDVCSSDLWRLICAPIFVRRATVAHEVAHLAHMDHSPAFHARHADIYGGDPVPARQWLREHGAMLHRIGASKGDVDTRSEEYTSELQSLMRTSYVDLCLKNKIVTHQDTH